MMFDGQCTRRGLVGRSVRPRRLLCVALAAGPCGNVLLALAAAAGAPLNHASPTPSSGRERKFAVVAHGGM